MGSWFKAITGLQPVLPPPNRHVEDVTAWKGLQQCAQQLGRWVQVTLRE